MPNGVGPQWFPVPVRNALTRLSGLFFSEAGWQRHDEGYARGYPARAICDRKFLQAMIRDASRVNTTARVWACIGLAGVFWLMVRLFGWASFARDKSI